MRESLSAKEGKDMKQYSTIIFDLDGTLLNTLKDLQLSVNYALEKNSYPTRNADEVRRFVGNGIRKLVERAVPAHLSVADIDKVFKDFKVYYDAHATDNTALYDGIDKMLEVFNNECNLAIVSNKAQSAVDILWKRFFSDTVPIAVGDVEGQQRKPAPDSVFKVMNHFNAKPEETLYVGDSEVDIETAKNAGIDCISVSWGFRDISELVRYGAKKIVNSPEELIDELS